MENRRREGRRAPPSFERLDRRDVPATLMNGMGPSGLFSTVNTPAVVASPFGVGTATSLGVGSLGIGGTFAFVSTPFGPVGVNVGSINPTMAGMTVGVSPTGLGSVSATVNAPTTPVGVNAVSQPAAALTPVRNSTPQRGGLPVAAITPRATISFNAPRVFPFVNLAAVRAATTPGPFHVVSVQISSRPRLAGAAAPGGSPFRIASVGISGGFSSSPFNRLGPARFSVFSA